MYSACHTLHLEVFALYLEPLALYLESFTLYLEVFALNLEASAVYFAYRAMLFAASDATVEQESQLVGHFPYLRGPSRREGSLSGVISSRLSRSMAPASV